MIALIPARKNSKRFPGKNRASLGGRSLLEITNNVARESGLFENVFLSTDDEELAEMARQLNIQVPFARSPDLAAADTTSWAVVEDFRIRLDYVDALCLLQLTSPLRRAEDLVDLHRVFIHSQEGKALIVTDSVQESPDVSFSIYRCMCSAKLSMVRHCAGASLVSPNGMGYIVGGPREDGNPFDSLEGVPASYVPPERSIDIDFEHQLRALEAKTQNRRDANTI